MVAENKSSNYLTFVPFANFNNWSVQYLLETKNSYNEKYDFVKIGSFLRRNKTSINIENNVTYKRITVKINNNGVYLRDTEKGINIGTKKQFLAQKGNYIISKIDARNGAFGIIPEELNNAIVTNDFPLFYVDETKININFLLLITTTKEFIKFAQSCSSGTTNRQRMDVDLFLEQKIPLPTLEKQNRIVANYNTKLQLAQEQEEQAKTLESEIESYLFEELGILKTEEIKSNSLLQFIKYTKITEWGTDKIFNSNKIRSSIFEMTSFEINPNFAKSIFRGKSPKYAENSTKIILNQKCNRWNKIELEHSKTVEEQWFNSIDNEFLTKEGDIIINSTGEGTIGRATFVTKENEGLLYDSHLLLLRVNRELLDPLFYVYLFNSPFGQNQVDSIKSAQTTKQTELGVSNLKKIIFPQIPVEKQNQISNHINSLKTQIKELNVLSAKNKEEAIVEFEKEIFN
jgi:restriction endonuclease S subunit